MSSQTSAAPTHSAGRGARIIRMRALMEKIDLGRTAIYARLDPKNPIHDPSFPKPIPIGGKTIGFLEAEVDAWIESRVAMRGMRGNEAKAA